MEVCVAKFNPWGDRRAERNFDSNYMPVVKLIERLYLEQIISSMARH